MAHQSYLILIKDKTILLNLILGEQIVPFQTLVAFNRMRQDELTTQGQRTDVCYCSMKSTA